MTNELCAKDRALPWLRLTLVPGVSSAMQRALLSRFGSPHAVLCAEASSLEGCVGREACSALLAGPAPRLLERTLRWLESPAHHLVTLADDEYPRALLEIADPPTALYAEGRLELLNAPAFAIVGSRNASSMGRRDAQMFAKELSRSGLCIVSGMALGIDSAAHRGGLSSTGSSIAVLGTGIDVTYPPDNGDLARELAAAGCVVSEFALGTAPFRRNFPQRNRLISGLSRGVLVVEAGLRSGTLLTAKCAVDQGRDVFCVPGSIHSTLTKGCHALIKQGAKLTERVEDILGEIGWKSVGNTPTMPLFDESEHPLLEAMGDSPASVDDIARRIAMPAAQVASNLSRFELEGRVAALPGGRFQRITGTTPGRMDAGRVIE